LHIFLIKTAAVLNLVFAVGHTFGTLAVSRGPDGAALAGQSVLVAGNMRTFGGLFEGYGLMITVMLIMTGILLWQLASARLATRGVIGVIALASAANAVISALYLVFIPVVFLILITACLVAAFMLMGKNYA